MSNSFGNQVQQLHRIYAMVGEATTAYNAAEQLWFLIFQLLLRPLSLKTSTAIYGLFKTGNLQRQLAMAVAGTVLEGEEREAIGKLHARTNDLASRRNDVIHAIIRIGGPLDKPQIQASGVHAVPKLASKDNIEEVEARRSDSRDASACGMPGMDIQSCLLPV